jgi:hypothetical protein
MPEMVSMKSSKVWKWVKGMAVGAGASAMGAASALATPVIDNDSLQGMGNLGTDIGNFLGNLGPGLGKFLLIMGIFGGIVAILAAVFYVIKNYVGKNRR